MNTRKIKASKDAYLLGMYELTNLFLDQRFWTSYQNYATLLSRKIIIPFQY